MTSPAELTSGLAPESVAPEPVAAESAAPEPTAPQPRLPEPNESASGQSTAAIAEPDREPADAEPDREPTSAEPDRAQAWAEPDGNAGAETDEQAVAEAEKHTRVGADEHTEAEADEHPRAEVDEYAGVEADEQAEAEADEHPRAQVDEHAGVEADEHAGVEADEHPWAEADEQPWAEADEHPWVEADENTGTRADERAGRARGGGWLAGAAIAILVIGLAAAVGTLAVATHGFRPKTVVTYRLPAVFGLRTGDCIDSSQNGLSVTVLPCASPHDAEVFATFSLAGSSWPGSDAVGQRAGTGCGNRIAGYLNPALANAGLAEEYVYPDRQAWQAGVRTVVCEISAATGQLTGSVRQGG